MVLSIHASIAATIIVTYTDKFYIGSISRYSIGLRLVCTGTQVKPRYERGATCIAFNIAVYTYIYRYKHIYRRTHILVNPYLNCIHRKTYTHTHIYTHIYPKNLYIGVYICVYIYF